MWIVITLGILNLLWVGAIIFLVSCSGTAPKFQFPEFQFPKNEYENKSSKLIEEETTNHNTDETVAHK